jgi:hypothetical protein
VAETGPSDVAAAIHELTVQMAAQGDLLMAYRDAATERADRIVELKDRVKHEQAVMRSWRTRAQKAEAALKKSDAKYKKLRRSRVVRLALAARHPLRAMRRH